MLTFFATHMQACAGEGSKGDHFWEFAGNTIRLHGVKDSGEDLCLAVGGSEDDGYTLEASKCADGVEKSQQFSQLGADLEFLNVPTNRLEWAGKGLCVTAADDKLELKDCADGQARAVVFATHT